MKKYFSIKQAAEMAHMTSETLRHYDRFGLVKPCRVDEFSQYRYYSEQELVRLQTVELLKCMDLSLKEIKDLLQQNDLAKIVALLKRAEQKAVEKIERLQYAREKIKRAYSDYEKKLDAQNGQNADIHVRRLKQRFILISDTLEYPTVHNLWNYHRHFFEQLGEPLNQLFSFEDVAGIIVRQEQPRLFAVCARYPSAEGLTVLPEGEYLCSDCTEKNKDDMTKRLLEKAKTEYGVEAPCAVQIIVVAGVLQWNYQIQVFLGAVL